MEIKTRTKVLTALFIAWAAALAATVFHYTVTERESYLRQSRQSSEREGVIPAIRGRILDRDGRPIAWSTRHYDLRVKQLQSLVSVKRRRIIVDRLAGRVQPQPTCEDILPGRTLKKDLSPGEVQEFGDLLEQLPELTITPRFERRTVDYAAAKALLGKTESKGGVSVGVSGYELKLDGDLRGQDGLFRVMIDKQGKWIPGTWKAEREMLPGKDIRVKQTLEEIVGTPKSVASPSPEAE